MEITIKAKEHGIRYFGAFAYIPTEVRKKLRQLKQVKISTDWLQNMDPTTYDIIPETVKTTKKVRTKTRKKKDSTNKVKGHRPFATSTDKEVIGDADSEPKTVIEDQNKPIEAVEDVDITQAASEDSKEID